jgi:hypothetical protein
MLLSKNQFFILLLLLFVAPQLAYKLYWLMRSEKTRGIMCFTGHTLETVGVSTHPVIRFKAGKDSLFFNGNSNVSFPTGQLVSVRYQKDNPSDARIDIPVSIWGDTLAWSLFPILVIGVLYLTPKRLAPLIPWGTRLLLTTKKPFIKIIPTKS